MNLDFNDAGAHLTWKIILQNVTEEEIYKRYCNAFPTRSMKSPMPGRRDKHPSFGFFPDGHRWKWKDNATGEGGDVFDFVEQLEGLSRQGAIDDIGRTFGISVFDNQTNPRIASTPMGLVLDKQERKRALIQAVQRPYSLNDIWVWSRLSIERPELDFFGVKVADQVWMQKPEWDKKILLWTYRPDNPIFYWISPYSDHIKCYRPFEKDKKRKWLSNMDDITDIQGYKQANIKVDKNKPLILVKSQKENMFFHSFGYKTMAQNAEGYIINDDFVRHLKSYCYPIISLYDRDPSGVKGMKRLKAEHNIPGLVIPNWGAKDPTDLWLRNYKQVYKLLNIIDEYFEFIRSGAGVDGHSFGFRYT